MPKDQWPEAAEKLARFEDIEENGSGMCGRLKKAADAVQEKDPAMSALLRQAAREMAVITDFEDSQSLMLRRKMAAQKKELLGLLEEVDRQGYDDPVFVIREKVEELM